MRYIVSVSIYCILFVFISHLLRYIVRGCFNLKMVYGGGKGGKGIYLAFRTGVNDESGIQRGTQKKIYIYIIIIHIRARTVEMYVCCWLKRAERQARKGKKNGRGYDQIVQYIIRIGASMLRIKLGNGPVMRR